MSLALLPAALLFAESFQIAGAAEGCAFTKYAGELPQAALPAAVQWCRAPIIEDKLINVHNRCTRLLSVRHKQTNLSECLKCDFENCLPVIQLELVLEKMASPVGEK